MAIDDKWIIDLKGRSYVQYGGLLSEAHERGLLGIETTLVQIPNEQNGNMAIVKAIVRLKDGSTFEGIGDASPQNVARHLTTALIRMAETRSKGRALRDAINVGVTMLEELPDEEAHAAHAPAVRNGGQTPHATPHAAARAKEAAEERRSGAEKAMAAGSSAGKTPGFEPTYSEPGTRHYTREELISGTRKRLEQARALGISEPDHKPELMANKALFGLAEKLTEQIKEAKAAAEGQA